MKPEPLKGKYRRTEQGWQELVIIGDKKVWVFVEPDGENVLHDVKSAVQGLLEEIENYPPEFIMEAETEKEAEEIKNEILNLIKKWFSDVVMEDDNNIETR